MSLLRATTRIPAPDGDHDCDLWRWVLAGPRGATGFAAYCYPPGSFMVALARTAPLVYRIDPDGAAWLGTIVDCHAPRPMYDGHEPHGDCDVLPAGACFYDGNGLQAQVLLGEWAGADWDEEVIWSTLTHVYNTRFHPDAEALRDALEEMAADPAAVDEAARLLAAQAKVERRYLFGDPKGMADPGFMDGVRPGYTDRQQP